VGHFFALITIIIWGTTFVASRALVNAGLRPVEIVFFRFLIGWLFLVILRPRGFRLPLSLEIVKKDKLLILSGICLIPVYFMLENTAVAHTLASNVSLFVATSPLFIALISRFVLRKMDISKRFGVGAVLCLLGVFLVVTGGIVRVNPLGDFLAIGAAVASAIYSLLGERLGKLTKSTVAEDRLVRMQRVFFYGLIFLLPIMPLAGFHADVNLFSKILQPSVLAQIVYLGLAASAFAFIIWNEALVRLGALSAGLYLYLIPVVTISFAMVILNERLTVLSAVGAVLIIFGLMVAEHWIDKVISVIKQT